MSATVTRLATRRRRPGRPTAVHSRLIEAGMNWTALGSEVQAGLLELAGHEWRMRDPYALHRIERLVRKAASIVEEGRRISGIADAIAPACADGIDAPGHGHAAGE